MGNDLTLVSEWLCVREARGEALFLDGGLGHLWVEWEGTGVWLESAPCDLFIAPLWALGTSPCAVPP